MFVLFVSVKSPFCASATAAGFDHLGKIAALEADASVNFYVVDFVSVDPTTQRCLLDFQGHTQFVWG
jgi:hypothetical protein